MKTKYSPLPFLVCVFGAGALLGQTPPGTDLDAARQFVRSLPANRVAAEGVISGTGRDRANALLMAVFNQGMSAKASLDDWADLHRTLTGLVELYSTQASPTDIYRASVFANLQDSMYRNHERDYARALQAAQESLSLVERSGLTETLYVSWNAVGQDLLSLGRTAEALDALHKSRDLIPASQAYSHNAAQVLRDIIALELARGNPAGATEELARFGDSAKAAPPYYRAEALLAKADVDLAQQRYAEVPDLVNQARQLILDPVEKVTFEYEATLELMDCVLDVTGGLSYPEALSLAATIQKQVSGLPIDVSAFAQQAARSRRRLAGDIDGILRADSADVDNARSSGSVQGQIEGLRILAADFAAAGSVANQISALEQAVALVRTQLPLDGVPHGYPAAYSFAGTSLGLAAAYARTTPFGITERNKANQLLADALAAIDKQPAAADRERLASIRGQVDLERTEILMLANQKEAARSILQAALNASSSARYDKSDVYMRLARLDRDDAPDAAAGNYDLAIAEYRASRQVLYEIAARLEAARSLARKGRSEKARAHLDIVTKELTQAGFADAEWKLSYVSGIVLQGEGSLDQAANAYRNSITKVEAVRATLAESERQTFTDSEWVADLYSRQVAVLSQLGRRQEAWQYAERGKARAFVESLQGRKFQETIPSSYQNQLASLDRQMIELRLQLAPENDLLLQSSKRSAASVETELAGLETRYTLLREEAGLANSRASKAVTLDPPALVDIQAALKKLDKGAVLIEYAILPDGLAAFLIGPSSFEQVAWKTDVNQLDKSVRQLRGLLEDSSSREELNSRLPEIAATLWKPIAEKLPAGTRRLVIVPASFLNYIPFQVLPLPNGKALIDQYTISYVPSAATLSLLGAWEPMGKDLFLGALGNVDVEGLGPLPGTASEVDGISLVYPSATVVKEKALTHDAVLQALRTHQTVHLATHGIYDPQAPMFSALLTSPSPSQAARVSLYELIDVQLKARLVVLSACESGTGKLTQGDEISGFTRTILSAGAKTVLSSLWDVDDDSTAMMMREFYSQLSKGRSPSEALRSAALAVRQKYPHPMYWAPFVLTGSF